MIVKETADLQPALALAGITLKRDKRLIKKINMGAIVEDKIPIGKW